MAVRVLLLMVFTGLFATAWSSDRPEAAGQLIASDRRPLPLRPSADENDRDMLQVAQVGRTISISSELDLSIVVPPELMAPGTYRVVDAQGRVGWMSVPVSNSPEYAGIEPQPIYTNETAYGHWYFIRVEAAPVIASPLEATAVRQ